jgi:hypothetical protein
MAVSQSLTKRIVVSRSIHSLTTMLARDFGKIADSHKRR